MMKRMAILALSASALLLVVVGFLTKPTSAQSSGTDIWCGLWAGATFNFSSNLNCSTNSTSSRTPSKTSTSTPPTTKGAYAALGDSVAAGLGLPTSSSATPNDFQCGRSTQGYPNRVANSLGMPLINASCSGATAGDLVTSQGVSGPNLPAQLATAFASGTPKLISITAGANDAHWASFIRTCYTTNCNTTTTTTIADGYLALLRAKLTYALGDIYTRSGGNPPKVVVTGYYNPVSAGCATLQQNITPAEITWITNETNALNQTIRNSAAQYSFATYVPISFAGHDICTSNSWVQDFNDPAPFHPTAAGQAAIARAVTQARY